MRDFWEWVGVVFSLILVGILAIGGFIVAAALFLFWPAVAVVLVFIAGRAVGVW